jgi:tetratricopeptide (TPR) repeat protein
MDTAPDALAAPGPICPSCGAPLAPQSQRCDQCGALIPLMPDGSIGTMTTPYEPVLQEMAPPGAGMSSSSKPASAQQGVSEVVATGESLPSFQVGSGDFQAARLSVTETIPVASLAPGDQDLSTAPQARWEAPTSLALHTEVRSPAPGFVADPELERGLALMDSAEALETQLAIIEAPESPPRVRRFRIHLRGSLDAALLTWGPWALSIGGLIALIMLAVTTPSWGNIATRAGITLLVISLGAASLIQFLRIRQQHQAHRRWLVVTASLLVIGILSVALAPTIHSIQARALESQGNYQQAIEEYTASGEHSPNGQDIARCYLEWGQRDLKSQHYAMAVQHLGAAAEDYSATLAAKQAREPMGQALLQWGLELAAQERYAQAIQQFERLRKHYTGTAAARQAQIDQDESAAYYFWGQTLQASQQFQQALASFQAIGKFFPNSPYTTPAYNAAASDLYAWARALVQQAKYTDAIATYQQLIKQYTNAPEAKQAQQDLAAPQPVTGRLIFASGSPDANVIIRLSSNWTTGPNGYLQGGYVYEARTDAQGNFSFPGVALGKYLVDWQQGTTFTTLLHPATYNPVYIADVEPLHGTDLGDVQVAG